MNRLEHKKRTAQLRTHRVRTMVRGTLTRPRLSVHITNLHISAQLIDDTSSNTLIYVSTVGQKTLKGTMTEKASWVGEVVAKSAKAKKINKIVFDRGSKRYHGRVKALAEAARNGGLEF